MGKVRAVLLSAEVTVLIGLSALLVVWYLVSSTAFLLYFGWPAGAIWSDLIASVLCVGFALWRLRIQAIAHHAEKLAQAARHHREQMALLKRQHLAAMATQRVQHEALKQHVSREVKKVAA